MYATRTTQIVVGIFGVLGLIALAILSIRLGNVQIFSPPSYEIYANFDNISGLKKGDAVSIAGVRVGRVSKITLNKERAQVEMTIDAGVKIDDEAIAAIRTLGIIGAKYVGISPGPSDRYLSDGGFLRQTESAFVLEDAIGQLLNNAGTSSSSDKQGGNGGTGTTQAPVAATPVPTTPVKPSGTTKKKPAHPAHPAAPGLTTPRLE